MKFPRVPWAGWFLFGLTVVSLFLMRVPNRSAVPEKNASLNASRRTGAFERDGARGVPTRAQLASNYGRLPLSFEANHGQTNPQVKFLSRGHGYSLFLTAGEAVLTLEKPSPKRDSYTSSPRRRTGLRASRPGAACSRAQA